jgi:hypothetical protein
VFLMTKKPPIPFPAKQPDSLPKPGVEQHSRLILKLGNSRYAFDFHSSVTELKPQPARVLSITRRPNRLKPVDG